jgi:hypothetical protein
LEKPVNTADALCVEQRGEGFREREVRGIEESVAELGVRVDAVAPGSESLNVLPDTRSGDFEGRGEKAS